MKKTTVDAPEPCPNCGHCPTCGASPVKVQPVYPVPYYPWVQPWEPYVQPYTITYTSDTTNAYGGVAPTYTVTS